MARDFPHVFQPFRLKNLELRNRIVRGAHTTALASDGIGDALIRYHVERARGGVALSVIEAAGVHPTCAYGIPIQDDAIIPGLRRLVDAVATEGMHLIQQLFHMGPHGINTAGSPSWAASYIPGAAPDQLSHPMTVEEIKEVVDGFAAAARRCREAGVGGVEVHCAHGYLLHSFLSAATNQRTDGYGGSFDNRLRFTREAISAIRAQVGADYVVGVRLSTEDGVHDGTDAASCAEIAKALCDDGEIDYISLSCGNSGYQPSRLYSPLPARHGYEMPYSRQVTSAVSLPTMVTGRFMSVADAEAAIAAGEADLVSMVRALLADPQLVAKTRDGRADQVRPCIGCNQSCVGGIRRYDGQSGAQRLECTVNAAAGHETTLSDEDVERCAAPLRVLVVGGGPAGLEAARVAALGGHDVQLHERIDALGGQLRLTRANSARAETALVIDWWERELGRLGVAVHTGSAVDRGAIERQRPDAIVVATGSRPRHELFQSLMPAFDVGGQTPKRFLGAWEVLEGAEVGSSCMVLDDFGHFEAIDVAEHVLQRGARVEFVTRYTSVGWRLGGPLAWEALGQPHLAHMLGDPRFALHARSFLSRIDADSATIAALDAPQRTTTLRADTVVAVAGNVPERDLADLLAGEGIATTVVGDAIDGPKLLAHAVLSGNLAGRTIAKRP